MGTIAIQFISALFGAAGALFAASCAAEQGFIDAPSLGADYGYALDTLVLEPAGASSHGGVAAQALAISLPSGWRARLAPRSEIAEMAAPVGSLEQLTQRLDGAVAHPALAALRGWLVNTYAQLERAGYHIAIALSGQPQLTAAHAGAGDRPGSAPPLDERVLYSRTIRFEPKGLTPKEPGRGDKPKKQLLRRPVEIHLTLDDIKHHLNDTQMRIFWELPTEDTYAQIGERLGLSDQTVARYSREIFDLLGVERRQEAAAIVEHFQLQSSGGAPRKPSVTLTDYQREVLGHIVAGRTDEDIKRILARDTVSEIRQVAQQLFNLFGLNGQARNRTSLVKAAIDRGIVEPPNK